MRIIIQPDEGESGNTIEYQNVQLAVLGIQHAPDNVNVLRVCPWIVPGEAKKFKPALIGLAHETIAHLEMM